MSSAGMNPRASSGFVAEVLVILVGFQISLATNSANDWLVMALTTKLRIGNAMLEYTVCGENGASAGARWPKCWKNTRHGELWIVSSDKEPLTSSVACRSTKEARAP